MDTYEGVQNPIFRIMNYNIPDLTKNEKLKTLQSLLMKHQITDKLFAILKNVINNIIIEIKD